MLAFNGYEADGVTPRIMNRYDVTRRLLSRYGDKIRLKVKMGRAFDGISIKVDESVLDDLLGDLAGNQDIAWAEPDFDFGQLWHTPEKKGAPSRAIDSMGGCPDRRRSIQAKEREGNPRLCHGIPAFRRKI